MEDRLGFQRARCQGGDVSYVSADGEEGFPGELKVTATYSLNDQNELKLEYRATTSKPTVLNLTNHSYFNLSGNDARDVMGNMVTLHAARFTPVDATLIPTGERQAVAGTPFDFRKPPSGGRPHPRRPRPADPLSAAAMTTTSSSMARPAPCGPPRVSKSRFRAG